MKRIFISLLIGSMIGMILSIMLLTNSLYNAHHLKKQLEIVRDINEKYLYELIEINHKYDSIQHNQESLREIVYITEKECQRLRRNRSKSISQ